MYHPDVNHLANEGYVLGWQGRAVVPSHAVAGHREIATIVERDGHRLQNIDLDGRDNRSPIGPIATWPDEGLVTGVHRRRFQVAFIELDGTSCLVDTDLNNESLHDRRFFQLVATADGAVIASAPTQRADLSNLGWSIDLRLDSVYATARRAPFEDFECAATLVTRAGQGWSVPGRAAVVADDIAIFEEGSGAKREIVARQVADARELWRRSAIDTFVLGAIPMPAWSDDRIYVIDRGDRRKQAWAREQETAAIHRVSATDPMRTMLSVRAVSRARGENPITAPAILACWSTRTGTELWHAKLDGDVVSFHCHPKWVACTLAAVRGKLLVWRHDGTLAGEGVATPLLPYGAGQWPPDAGRWPCLAWGVDEHVLVVQYRSKKQGGHRMYAARIASPDVPVWETAMPVPVVNVPQLRYHRLVNRVPMAFVQDAAFLRWGKQLHGFLP